MNVAVIGLGLIGGSFARALREKGHTVFAYDADYPTVLAAKAAEAIDAPCTESALSASDFIIIALYPSAAAEFLEKNADVIPKSATVIDACGTKRKVCEECGKIAEAHGFTFIGGHPMAGSQYSGFAHSRAGLFHGATMLLCPRENEDIAKVESARDFILSLGFGKVHFTSPEEHDRMIAFTSQLAHIVSNAYVKSPSAPMCRPFAAGSYRDLTRVARLNPTMWTELFLENSDSLSAELDKLIASLNEYSEALKSGDGERLKSLLEEGVRAKLTSEK